MNNMTLGGWLIVVPLIVFLLFVVSYFIYVFRESFGRNNWKGWTFLGVAFLMAVSLISGIGLVLIGG